MNTTTGDVTPISTPAPATSPLATSSSLAAQTSTADKIGAAAVASATQINKAAAFVSKASDVLSSSSDVVSPFAAALLDAAPALAGAWAATSSLLEAISEAPMVGPAAKLLLLFAAGIEAVAGYAELVARAKRTISDLAQALKDIDAMVPRGVQHSPTLTAWVGRLREALEAASVDNAAALRASERSSFVMRLICKVKGAVFDADRLQASLDALDTQWLALGPALTIQVGWSLAASPTLLLPQLRAMLTEAAVDASATAAPRPPACVPSSLRAPPGLRPAQVALHADIICEATAVASPVGQKGAELALVTLLCGTPSGISGAVEPSSAVVQLHAARLAMQCWATSVALKAARDPNRPPLPLLVHVDLGVASTSISAGGATRILSDAINTAADDMGLPSATVPVAASAGAVLAAAVTRLPRPKPGGSQYLAWAIVVSGVASPSSDLDWLLRDVFPLLVDAATPASEALSSSVGGLQRFSDPAVNNGSEVSQSWRCCCLIQASVAPGLTTDDPVSLSTWNAAALALGIPAAFVVPGAWLEGVPRGRDQGYQGLIQESLPSPLLRLITALAGAAAHDAVTPGPGARCSAAIPQLPGLLARCAVAARNAAIVFATQLRPPAGALLPSWVPRAAEAADDLFLAIDRCGSPPATADLRRVVINATRLFAAVIGEEPSDTEEMPHRPSLGRSAWLSPSVPANLYLEVAALAAEQDASQGARHEASLEAIQAVAAVVAATMDVVISPDEINQRLVAGNLKLAVLHSFLPNAADDEAGYEGAASEAPLTVLTAPAVPLTLWRYSERAAAVAGAFVRGERRTSSATPVVSSNSEADTGPGRLLRNPADAEAEVQGDTTTAAQAIVNSRELCIITGVVSDNHCFRVGVMAQRCAWRLRNALILSPPCRHSWQWQDRITPYHSLSSRSRQDSLRPEPARVA